MGEMILPPGKYVEYYVFNKVWNKKIVTFEEYYHLLSKITLKNIQNMAKYIFKPGHLLLAIGGNINRKKI